MDLGILSNISHSYLKGAARSELVRVKAVADMRMEAAQAKAAEYGVQAVTVDQLLADPAIQIEFFFKRGGGPVLDMGPYYITQLVNLLGPVERVTAQATMGSATRTVSSEPLKGSVIQVEVPTTVNGLLSFANGASVTITTSWDVWKHQRAPFELYGTEGSMLVPDPNFFGGEPMVTTRDGDWMPLEISAHPFGKPNRQTQSGLHVADYRIVGVLDMAAAIRGNRKHRASGELAMHVLEVLDALERSSIEGRHVMIETPCDRPEPLSLGEGEEVFAAS